jgi:purine-binding chemotaxis protein CheW
MTRRQKPIALHATAAAVRRRCQPKERARIATQQDIQIVIFRIGRERYALPTTVAREVIGYEPPRRLPGAEPWVEGVLNLRGEIVPVCDLMCALGMEPIRERLQIVVCELRQGSVGLLVEEVSSVLAIPADTFDRPSSLRHPALAGLAQLENSLVVLLDLEVALASDGDLLAGVGAPVRENIQAAAAELAAAAGESAAQPPAAADASPTPVERQEAA